jgi:hypothetical protein
MHIDCKQSPQAPPWALPFGRSSIASAHGTAGADDSSIEASLVIEASSAAGGMKGPPGLDELHAKPTAAAVKPATTTANRRLLKEGCIDT